PGPKEAAVRVRRARRGDMAAVARMARELAAAVRDPDPGDGAAGLIRAGFGRDRWFECHVVESDGAVVGFALACRRFEAHTGERRLWIGDLYISPAARRTGAARMLLAALHRRADAL